MKFAEVHSENTICSLKIEKLRINLTWSQKFVIPIILSLIVFGKFQISSFFYIFWLFSNNLSTIQTQQNTCFAWPSHNLFRPKRTHTDRFRIDDYKRNLIFFYLILFFVLYSLCWYSMLFRTVRFTVTVYLHFFESGSGGWFLDSG